MTQIEGFWLSYMLILFFPYFKLHQLIFVRFSEIWNLLLIWGNLMIFSILFHKFFMLVLSIFTIVIEIGHCCWKIRCFQQILSPFLHFCFCHRYCHVGLVSSWRYLLGMEGAVPFVKLIHVDRLSSILGEIEGLCFRLGHVRFGPLLRLFIGCFGNWICMKFYF